MGRRKLVSDEELIVFINKYYMDQCDGNASLLKIPAISQYIRSNGVKEFKDYLLRRNELVIKYLRSLKGAQNDEEIRIVATYKTIDVEEFIEHNHSTSALKRTLTNLSMYYKSVCDAAVKINQRYRELEQRTLCIEKESKARIDKLEKSSEEISELKATIMELNATNKVLKTIVDNYVYPEIANELLKLNGLLKDTEGIVNTEFLENGMIHADTMVKSHSNVILSMFNKFED